MMIMEVAMGLRLRVFVALVLVAASCAGEEADTSTSTSPSGLSSTLPSTTVTTPASGVSLWSDVGDVADVDLASDGTVWTAGLGGVVAWSPSGGSYRTYTMEDGLISNATHQIALAADGAVGVAYGFRTGDVWHGPDVSVLDEGVWTTTQLSDEETPTRWWIDTDADGRLVAFEGDEAYVYEGGSWVPGDAGRAGEFPGAVLADDEIWYPYWGVGLVQFPLESAPSVEMEGLEGLDLHVTEPYESEYEGSVGPGGPASLHVIPGLEYVAGVAFDGDFVWALGGAELARWDGEAWSEVDLPDLAGAEVSDVVTHGEMTWIGTNQGLARLLNGKLTWFRSDAPVQTQVIHLLVTDRGVATVSIPYRFGPGDIPVRYALISPESAEWFDELLSVDGLGPEGVVQNLVFDGDELLTARGDDLVDIWSGQVTPLDGPYWRTVRSLAIDGEGTIWADVEHAIWYRHGNIWVEAASTLELDYGLGPMAAKSGAGIWVSTSLGTLHSVDRSGVVATTPGSGLELITAMTVDGADVIVAGLLESGPAVSVWDGSSWTTSVVSSGFPGFGHITSVVRDVDGTIWLGDGESAYPTGGGGLMAFAGEEWWVVRSGLPSPTVLSLAMAGTGELWIGTSGGLMRVAPAELEAHVSGSVRTTRPATSPTSTIGPTTPAPPSTTTEPGRVPVRELEPGLFCRDLHAGGYSYADAVEYWAYEGSPPRMDADGNGIPCETVYPRDEVDAYWGGTVAPPFDPSSLYNSLVSFLEDEIVTPGYGGTVFCEMLWYGADQSGTHAELYLWQFCAEYYPAGDHIELGSAATYPVVVEFDYGSRGWQVSGMIEPADGEGWASSIRAMFPPDIAEQALADSGEIGPVLSEITVSMAEEYFGLPYLGP